MKGYVSVLLFLCFCVCMALPCQAQFLKQLKDNLVNQAQQQAPGAQQLIGNVNLPAGQYMMTNVQSGQAFYVFVQNGQMFLNNQPQQQLQQTQQPAVPGQTMTESGKGMLKNFLRNQLTPQTQPQQYPYQPQY